MTWTLILIVLTGGGVDSSRLGDYQTMAECFEEREEAVEMLGRPIINYQVVCVRSE